MLRLWIDTNCARSAKKLRLLLPLARKKGVTIVIHPQVYLERRRQMRVEKGEAFSSQLFDDLLAQLGIEVSRLELDQALAAGWADTLYARYPTSGGWEEAKQRTLGGMRSLGFEVLPGDMPMTTDWLIALMVEEEVSACAITHDSGEEWKVLRESRRLFSWSEAIAWLESLPSV
ncbi:hypothetical protein [Polyangium sorediatum]|uniref:PIN domain-containing protein n=1 Tax=Polyangium sorediatum TaxID=889274 RepID=A0ABT6NZP0_9BACT|nr:hypothetical protein [Polyangium sorediatum]MDI1433783.1 hypothetical protein [Polyangium sorediatum]